MTLTDFQNKLDYFTNLLGINQVKANEAIKWGYETLGSKPLAAKQAFIYLNTLSRYSPESSNSITEVQVDFIFSQLDHLLP